MSWGSFSIRLRARSTRFLVNIHHPRICGDITLQEIDPFGGNEIQVPLHAVPLYGLVSGVSLVGQVFEVRLDLGLAAVESKVDQGDLDQLETGPVGFRPVKDLQYPAPDFSVFRIPLCPL